jgi:hypothetical protein
VYEFTVAHILVPTVMYSILPWLAFENCYVSAYSSYHFVLAAFYVEVMAVARFLGVVGVVYNFQS